MTGRARKPLGGRRRGQDRPQSSPARRAAHRHAAGAHRLPRTGRGVLALRRALGKSHPRVVGVDDGAFDRNGRTAPIAAVLLSVPEQVEAVGLGEVHVDGTDATARIVRLLRAVLPTEGVRAVLLDGAVVGGFNVIDLDRLRAATGLPVVAVTRRRPDFSRIDAALSKWFPRSAPRRLALLRKHRLFSVPTAGAPIWAACTGCSRADARELVRRTSVRGYWPEPLRLAHLVASAVRPSVPGTKAKSKGRGGAPQAARRRRV